MSDEFTVEREDAPGHGRYVIHLPGGLEAEMTFRKIGATAIAVQIWWVLILVAVAIVIANFLS
jgi:hypothetical protein